MNIFHPSTPQRIDARNRAKELVVTMAGAKPTPDEFRENHIGKYPAVVVNTVLILCGVALLAAFYPSAMRLYEAGKESFYHAIPDQDKARAAGVSLIVMAELTLLICNLALAVIPSTPTYRFALNLGSVISTAIALVGNIQIGLWNQTESPIAWFETIAPPLLVVILSFVLKGVLLTRISESHQWQTAFKQALDRWQSDVRSAEQSPRFKQAYAAELKAVYMAINSEGRGRAERLQYLQSLTSQEWSALVKAAFAEDVWYDDGVEAIDGYMSRVEITPVPLPASVSVSADNGLMSVATDATYTRQLPSGQTDRRYTPNNAPRKMNARDLVFDYLDNNPQDANLPSRVLSDKIGVGHDSANKYRNEWVSIHQDA